MKKIANQTKKIIITLTGFIVLIIGIIMLIAPGPGWVIIIIGLGILATEYAWAHHLLHKAKSYYEKVKQRALSGMKSKKDSSSK